MRTKSISIFCTIFFVLQALALSGAINGLLIVLGVQAHPTPNSADPVSEATSSLTLVGAIYGVITNILTIISIYGLWQMKRWGVYLFVAIASVGSFITYVVQPAWVVQNNIGWWAPLILPAIYLTIVAINWSKLQNGFGFSHAQTTNT